MDILDDPYLLYAQLRKHQPICWDETRRLWVLTRYRDVLHGLKDPRLGSGLGQKLEKMRTDCRLRNERQELFADLFGLQIELCDGAAHTRLRALVKKAMRQVDLDAVRSFVRSRIDKTIRQFRGRSKIEIIHEIASPLPTATLLNLIGLGDDEMGLFFAETVNVLLSAFSAEKLAETEGRRADECAEALVDFVGRKAAQSRRARKQDLIYHLATVEEAGEGLSTVEITANLILLYAAGHGTTANLIGNGVLAIARDAHVQDRLRKFPSDVPKAIEEILRFDSPIQSVTRFVQADLDIDGFRVQSGDTVTLVIGSANRDPEEFHEPDLVCVDRDPNNHLAFGYGAHFCVGAFLARLQARMVVATLLQNTRRIAVGSDQLSWLSGPSFRGLKSLSIEYETRHEA